MYTIRTILLLLASNVFMTIAWYGHLKVKNYPIWTVILISWGIAFFEYVFQVPANRIGFSSGDFSLVQLKVLQEIITLSLFVPFAVFYMHQDLSWNYVWAALCMVGAAYFMFR